MSSDYSFELENLLNICKEIIENDFASYGLKERVLVRVKNSLRSLS